MSRIKRIIKNQIDGVMILLLFFVIALSILFIYLQNIDTNTKNYYNYKKNVEKLHLYNRQLNNTLMRSYRYLDNDRITLISKSFENELLLLQENPLTKLFGTDVSNIVQSIIKKYNQKIELIESFKTLNARITSSVYYLNELNKQIKDTGITDVNLERLFSDILFKIGQVFLDTDLNVLEIEKDLKVVTLYRGKDENIEYFSRHVEQFVKDVHLLKDILIRHKGLTLGDTIDSLDTLLEKEYLRNKRKEEVIGLIFFIFAFIVLILLIATYMKVLRNRKEVYYLAYHDTLTKLPNRTEFERYISTLISKPKKERKDFVLFFIDLDRFKVINDTLGHDVGDGMLIVLAQRICKAVGEKNMLARIGGDEFVAIIERKRDIKKITKLVNEVASAIRTPIQIREYTLNTTASIGIAKYPQDGYDKNTLLKHADSAMYHAKDKGRDTYAFYTEQLSIDIQRRLELEQELVHALKKKEFSVFYQPQYRLSTGDITGVEALVRWNSKTLGAVSPEEFISVAEDTGLIVELGYYIFEVACTTYVNWKKQGIDINMIAINISSVQLRQANAFYQFKKIMDETGIDAKHIEIELTERYIMEYTTEKLTILDELRSLGCRVSIDDFGTGYSSMSYLKSLSIDTIKIDKSFILDLPDNQHDAEVSKAIIVLSHSLGYEVIAEGIETAAQEELLESYHCDMGQGYYFAKPMSDVDIISFYHQKEKILL
jgi:diguanylate cyclase (GGDEF)-like protein